MSSGGQVRPQAFGDVAIHPASAPADATILWEQIGTDAARAREGEQHTARLQQLQRQAVDVFVSPRCAVGVGGRGANLGGSSTMASKRTPSFKTGAAMHSHRRP